MVELGTVDTVMFTVWKGGLKSVLWKAGLGQYDPICSLERSWGIFKCFIFCELERGKITYFLKRQRHKKEGSFVSFLFLKLG